MLDKFIHDAHTIKGAPSYEELRFIGEYAMKVPKGGVIVEIGCDYGRSTSMLANIAKLNGVKFYTVDNFSFQPGTQEVMWSNMERLGVKDYVTLLEGDSLEMSKNFNEEIDLLWIDGGHWEKGVIEDMQGFGSKVKKGSPIFFHDYGNAGFNDPSLNYTPGIDKRMKNHEKIGLVGTVIGFIK